MEESENRYRAFYESSVDGIALVDLNGRILDTNQAYADMLGYSRTELKKLTYQQLTPLKWRKNEAQIIEKQVIGGRGYSDEYEKEYLKKNGTILPVSIRVWRIENEQGKPDRLWAIVKDITKRKQMEQELKQYSEHLEQLVEEKTGEIRLTRERLDYLIQSNPAAIYSGKPSADLSDFQLTYMSERVVSMLGYEPGDFVGHRDFWTSHVHPEDLPPTLEGIQALWKTGQRSFSYRFLHKDGSYRWIRGEAKVGRDVNGKPIEVNGYWTDATERMRLEEENRKLNDELTLRLTEATDQVELLAKSRERLRTVPDVGSGLDIILDSVLWGFSLDFGAVLVLDRHENRVNVRASKCKGQEIRLEGSYPLGGFVELEDLQTKSVTKVVGVYERSIFGAAVVRLIPILSGKELYGVLAFGSMEHDLLDASSMRILEMYAELVYSFINERSITVIPERELTRAGGGVASLEPGQMYLVKKDLAKAFDIFASNVFSDREGLCVTRMFPPMVRSKYGLEKTPIVWLTGEASVGERSLQSIQDLSIVIGDFLEKATKPVILLDGFEYLVTTSGFDAFIRFIQILKDRIQRKSGVLIAPILEEALGPKEVALLQREAVTLA